MRRLRSIVGRALRAFYDDQMTHHAAALTYYALMSLFPALLLGVSLLGLVGQYPATYDAIMSYLREVAPRSALAPLDSSLRGALQHKGTAATTLVVGVVIALYGTTGVLEATRRALNVAFDVRRGRSFVRRKTVDVLSSVVLMLAILVSLVLVFVGGGFAEDLLGFVGLGPQVADVWNVVRWPAAVAVAVLVFAFVYYVTPDVRQRSFRRARRDRRCCAVADRVVGVRHVHLAGCGRWRDLRHVRGRDRAGRLDLAHERRVAVRRRDQRRDRAPQTDRRLGRSPASGLTSVRYGSGVRGWWFCPDHGPLFCEGGRLPSEGRWRVRSVRAPGCRLRRSSGQRRCAAHVRCDRRCRRLRLLGPSERRIASRCPLGLPAERRSWCRAVGGVGGASLIAAVRVRSVRSGAWARAARPRQSARLPSAACGCRVLGGDRTGRAPARG